MKKSNNLYRVRVLFSYPIKDEKIIDGLSWIEACELFKFYVASCLEFPEISVRCVNIFRHGKQKSIKLFQNY